MPQINTAVVEIFQPQVGLCFSTMPPAKRRRHRVIGPFLYSHINYSLCGVPATVFTRHSMLSYCLFLSQHKKTKTVKKKEKARKKAKNENKVSQKRKEKACRQTDRLSLYPENWTKEKKKRTKNLTRNSPLAMRIIAYQKWSYQDEPDGGQALGLLVLPSWRCRHPYTCSLSTM